jgi:predicted N-acyltransferase
MRSPVPFIATPMPVVASPVIRDDVELAHVAAADWNALAAGQPFLTHEFLTALHATGCATPRTGWTPRFLTAWDDTRLIGALPLYAKTHSYGEYVFDWGWAEAYRRHGRRYYPKLLAAVPFTPVAGPRLLAREPAVRRALLAYALELVRRHRYSTLHVLFLPREEAQEGEALGMIAREGVQFHWTNPGYRDFADFLSTFSHDKRKKVKQERRKLAESGVVFERKRGSEITPADWAFFYQCYESTYRAHHSTPYLTPSFFEEIGRTLRDNMLLVVGSREGRRLCSALDIYTGDTLWGRYWGVTQYVPGLHFEACYYQAIEFCIEQRIERFEGGAQGLHKLARGLLPAATHSVHAVGDREFAAAIADFCARERSEVEHSMDELAGASPFKRDTAV